MPTSIAPKDTFKSVGRDKLVKWVDTVASQSNRGKDESNKFWNAAKEALIQGFPNRFGEELLEEEGRPHLSIDDFCRLYEDRTRRFRPSYKRDEDPLYDRFWTVIGNINRFISRLYHGQTTLLCLHRALWFENSIKQEDLRIDVADWVLKK